MLEIILSMVVIMIIVPTLVLVENYIRSMRPGQNRAYILQPVYRVVKLFAKKDPANRSMAHWFPVGACLFALTTLYLVVSGGNFLLVLSGLIMMELFVLTGACYEKEPFGIMAAQRGIACVIIWSFTGMMIAASLYKATGTIILSDVSKYACEQLLILDLPFAFIALFAVLMIKGSVGFFDFGINGKALSFLDTALYTSYNGWSLAVTKITHWLEIGIWLRMISYFLPFPSWISFLALSVLYLAALLMDGFIPKITWKKGICMAWIWAGGLSVVNYIWLYL